MERVLMYARRSGFTAYTSTLLEAWRLSVAGLSSSIIDEFEIRSKPPAIIADEDITKYEVARFGINEAKIHRERGISLSSFFGMFKYYRQAYLDLLRTKIRELEDPDQSLLFVGRVFDIIEASICVEWAGGGEDQIVNRLQKKNREMTNEKNKYLTIFESLPNPVFLLSAKGTIDNMNLAAAKLLDKRSVAGGHYYSPLSKDLQNTIKDKQIGDLLPWLTVELQEFIAQGSVERVFEKSIQIEGDLRVFRVKISQMLDVSSKFNGLVLILEDITSLKKAQDEVKTLEGFIPICSHCKKMRDDEGYWSRLEEFIESRSDALFSHSICDDCVKMHYHHIDL
ncbi:PAS domain-containing protein [Desulfosediminicola flagellatus]|uniref:PAS domain-containing protein n=1 Tax=Desulfosediminicola flagellatus TaxID=2569541 RepID=UPI0010ACEBF8|nr:PAS domain-containing protein [Desulfosediminicola flagellatus]